MKGVTEEDELSVLSRPSALDPGPDEHEAQDPEGTQDEQAGFRQESSGFPHFGFRRSRGVGQGLRVVGMHAGCKATEAQRHHEPFQPPVLLMCHGSQIRRDGGPVL